MEPILTFFLVAAMVATLAVLVVGIVSFGFNSRASARYGTRLMAARVGLQGLALLLFVLVMLSTAP